MSRPGVGLSPERRKADDRERLIQALQGARRDDQVLIDRYRAALQRILDHGQTHDEPCHALHNGDCADVFQEIARAALAAG